MDDVQAITNVVCSYAEMLDAGDLDGLHRLFARTAVYSPGAADPLGGRDAIRSLIEDAVHLYDGVPSTEHLVTNLIVEIDAGGASATARSYYTALQARPELPLQAIIAGRWHDRLEKDGDQWWLVERVIYADLFGNLTHHIKGL
jgi:ketosteroid isomerase-like protein